MDDKDQAVAALKRQVTSADDRTAQAKAHFDPPPAPPEEFPKWVYKGKKTRLIATPEKFAELGGGWSDEPPPSPPPPRRDDDDDDD